jgi:hypothetical protein
VQVTLFDKESIIGGTKVTKLTCEVWSSGLEDWERATLSFVEQTSLVHVHDKQVGNEMYALFQDVLGRWIRVCLGKVKGDV